MPKPQDVDDVITKLHRLFDSTPWFKESDVMLHNGQVDVITLKELWILYWYANIMRERQREDE